MSRSKYLCKFCRKNLEWYNGIDRDYERNKLICDNCGRDLNVNANDVEVEE